MPIDTAREWLRIDGTDNDDVIKGLLDAIPDYIELSTGVTARQQKKEPLAETVAKFLLTLWYHAERTDSDRIQRTVDSLLKTLSLKAKQ